MTNFARIAALLAALPIWSAGVNLAPAADRPPRLVEFESPLALAGPQALQGYLRLPDGPGPSPAVVLLHGCGGGWRGIDERWGKLLAEWGYVTLTVDRFGTRGITNACTGGLPPQTLYDAYRALNFLVGQSSVDPDRVAVVGFSQGALLALLSVERGQIERSAKEKFRAAIGFYPPCLGLKGNMTVPTLILIGELDDWTPAKSAATLPKAATTGVSRARRARGFRSRSPSIPAPIMISTSRTSARPRSSWAITSNSTRRRGIDPSTRCRKFLYATIGGKEKQP